MAKVIELLLTPSGQAESLDVNVDFTAKLTALGPGWLLDAGTTPTAEYTPNDGTVSFTSIAVDPVGLKKVSCTATATTAGQYRAVFRARAVNGTAQAWLEVRGLLEVRAAA